MSGPPFPPAEQTNTAGSDGRRPDREAPQRRRDPGEAASPGRAGSASEPTPIPLDRAIGELAGPSVLGRSLLIGPGRSVPEPWIDRPEIQADASADPQVVEDLHAAWRQRRPIVIRWSGPLPTVDDSRTPFSSLDPGSEPPGERLRFAVTANAVDLRGPVPSFEPIDLAVAGGARPAPDGNPGDVILSDGNPALVDGGPLDLDLPGLLASADPDGDDPARDKNPTHQAVGLIPRVHLLAGRCLPLRTRAAPAAELAADQLAAVAHRCGPARILAPAGSGKTRVLTERTRHLVGDVGLDPRTVCLVAYNRRAKDEMRERLVDVARLDIRTLNSLALALAVGSGPFADRSAGRSTASTIDEREARRMLDRLLPGRRHRRLTDPLEPWIDALSACRLGLRDPDEVEAAYGGDVAGFGEVLDRYRAELSERNLLDFDEQILAAIDRLLTDPAARRVARAAAPVILIDEFQDLTPAHLLLVRLLAGPAGEVFAVGDDDQTIYGYAGASPEWLIHFDRFFPDPTDHRLTVNYRCPPAVVDAAVNLLSHNRQRVTKTITAGSPAAQPGDDDRSGDGLTILGGNPQHQLVARIGDLLSAGAAPEEIAVLARVNAALLPAAIHLNHGGIPVVRPYGVGPDLLDRSGVGAALSWLRLASGPAQALNGDDIRAALRRPPRSLHPRVADWATEQRSVAHLEALAGRLTKEREADTVREFAADVARLRRAADDGATTADLLDTVFHDIGLLGAATQLDTSQRSARRAAHADELAAVAAVADLHPQPQRFETWLRESLSSLPRFGDRVVGDGAGEEEGAAPTGVTLATIHTTKGLEWPHVVVHDVRGDLHPHRLATDTEEERRIFHVAVTRGRRTVTVTGSGPPSPFVSELAAPRPEDRPWPEADRPEAAVRSTGARPTAGAKPGPKPRAAPASEREATLREALTDWRRQRSKDDGVPAYVVFDNKTLDAIARSEPRSLGQLGAINGIGPAKLERFGADVLGLVASLDD